MEIQLERERERERDNGTAREDLETESEIEIGKGRGGRHAYARSVSHRGRKSSRITWRSVETNPKLNWTLSNRINPPKMENSQIES